MSEPQSEMRAALKTVQNLAQCGGDAEDALSAIDKVCRAALSQPPAPDAQREPVAIRCPQCFAEFAIAAVPQTALSKFVHSSEEERGKVYERVIPSAIEMQRQTATPQSEVAQY